MLIVQHQHPADGAAIYARHLPVAPGIVDLEASKTVKQRDFLI